MEAIQTFLTIHIVKRILITNTMFQIVFKKLIEAKKQGRF